ncbi:hypothetical protein ACWEPC_54690 [Nonomuraea sp. NPDC004297]
MRQDLAAVRAELSRAREQLGEMRGQLTAAQAAKQSARQQAEAAETRAADLLQALRERS